MTNVPSPCCIGAGVVECNALKYVGDDFLHGTNQIGGENQNYRYVMSSSTKNLLPLARKRKNIGDVDAEKEAHVQGRVQKKTGFTMPLIKLHKKPNFLLRKQLHTSKAAIETLSSTMVLVPLPSN